MYAFQKPFDYLVLDRDNTEYYKRWNTIEVYSNIETNTDSQI